ncbi:MAG: hypothetical protein HY929_01535 [Euryarchaeota archaeon]|nr:hypothetical protein [Euryarchaeota archaeon]
MEVKCPGSAAIRRPTIVIVKCTNCGEEVEIFADEMKAKCDKCGTIVFRESVPSCIEWCSYAKKCIGEEKYKKIIEEKLKK